MQHDVDGDEWYKNKSQSYSCRKISLITNSEKFVEDIEGTKEWGKSNEDRGNASMGIEKKFRSQKMQVVDDSIGQLRVPKLSLSNEHKCQTFLVK